MPLPAAPSTSSPRSAARSAGCSTSRRGPSRGRRTGAGWLRREASSDADPAGGIDLISVATGERRAVTSPKPPAFDVCPAFSPDGRALAYAACEGGGAGVAVCDIHVQALDDQLRPRAEARRLTRQAGWIQGVAWTRDGRSIVYGVNAIPNPYLWRVRADGRTPPERVELAGRGFALAVDGPRPGPSRVHPESLGRRRLARAARLVSGARHRVDVQRHVSAVLAGRPAHRLRIRPNGREGRDLADGRRRLESHSAHTGPGTLAGIASLVAGWSLDRLRFTRGERARRHLDDRHRRLGPAPGHAAIPPTRSSRAGRATAAGSTSARTVPAVTRSGGLRPRGKGKSR